MQDRYTGDIGDFGKFGLLRALVRENQETVRKLGVIWYLVPDETETTGGNLTAYLDDSAYGALDGDLHMLLRRIVNSGSRSVRLLRRTASCLRTLCSTGIPSTMAGRCGRAHDTCGSGKDGGGSGSQGR